MKNARQRFQEKLDKMSDDEMKKAGQMARQHLAERKEQEYQARRKVILFSLALIVVCVVISLIYSVR
jgi:hypothetical protein